MPSIIERVRIKSVPVFFAPHPALSLEGKGIDAASPSRGRIQEGAESPVFTTSPLPLSLRKERGLTITLPWDFIYPPNLPKGEENDRRQQRITQQGVVIRSRPLVSGLHSAV